MSIGIYMYKNKINEKYYICQSKNLERRHKQHIYRTFNSSTKEYNSIIHKAFRKYGINSFEYVILEECSIEDLNSKELYYINKFNSFNNGYNFSLGTSQPQGEKENIINITDDLLEGILNIKEISEKYNISDRTIRAINTGETWVRDIDYPINPKLVYYSHGNIYYCTDCGKEIKTNSDRCIDCSKINQRKVERPEPLILAKEIIDLGFEAVGRKYGVSGNSIKKWCVAYGMGKLKHEVSVWYEKNK